MQVDSTEGRPRPHLTRPLILEAAMRLLDREGIEGLSMRRLATELGAAPMAVYSHFRDKAELESGLVDAVMGEIALPEESDDASWREQLVEIAKDFRRVLLAHPALVPFCITERTVGPNVMAIWERVIALLDRSGLDEPTMAHLMNCAYAFMIGNVVMEAARTPGPGVTPEEREELERQFRLSLESIPLSRYPRTAGLAEHLLECSGEEFYESGLRRLLAGFETGSDAEVEAAGLRSAP